jgi:hypothetical protein
MTGADEMIMETAGSSENSVNLGHAARRRIPEDSNIQGFSVFYDASTGVVSHTTFCSLCIIVL